MPLYEFQKPLYLDEKIDQFHYDCGKCPSGILNLSLYIKTKDLTLQNKIKKINMSNVQCAQCNNKPACNADTFFESQLFCWEKEFNKWAAKKGKKICKKEMCFISVDKIEMSLVQGCGKCTGQKNLTKCSNCSKSLCNTEAALPPPIKCHFLADNFLPHVKINKTCHYVYDSCYIARDVFGRVEQNCGECPLKYQNCIKCNNDFCNEETLFHLTTIQTTKITTSTTIIKFTNKSLVQGCDKCTGQKNLTKCSNCSKSLCNTEAALPPPIKCHFLADNFLPHVKINKTCHYVYDSCYIARDVFGRVEQNCGECPLKYQNCIKCNNDFCNEETLFHLTTIQTTKITTSTTIIKFTNKSELSLVNKTIAATMRSVKSKANPNIDQINYKLIFVYFLIKILMIL
uniref:Uncharacterized protein n=1 Tax=Meloidogyne enterolobii TaxID=390850 RepID=A0A6V7W3Z0_MELEN|nr:unnamed protein product [Meloidogyne enterolobii]